MQYNGKGYVGGGIKYPTSGLNVTDYLRDFWEYDPVTDTWTKKANIPGRRMEAQGLTANGGGYIGLGLHRNSSGAGAERKDWWKYNPNTDTWTRIADYSGAPRHATFGFELGGVFYVGGGIDYHPGPPTVYKDYSSYYHTTDTWYLSLQSYPGGSAEYTTSFSIHDSGYVVQGNLQEFWMYVK